MFIYWNTSEHVLMALCNISDGDIKKSISDVISSTRTSSAIMQIRHVFIREGYHKNLPVKDPNTDRNERGGLGLIPFEGLSKQSTTIQAPSDTSGWKQELTQNGY